MYLQYEYQVYIWFTLVRSTLTKLWKYDNLCGSISVIAFNFHSVIEISETLEVVFNKKLELVTFYFYYRYRSYLSRSVSITIKSIVSYSYTNNLAGQADIQVVSLAMTLISLSLISYHSFLKKKFILTYILFEKPGVKVSTKNPFLLIIQKPFIKKLLQH